MHYNSIIEILQEAVDKITQEKWKEDNCPPKFFISNLWEHEKSQKLILTVTHMNNNFSRVLYPIEKNLWEYDNLNKVMEDLYNQTM